MWTLLTSNSDFVWNSLRDFAGSTGIAGFFADLGWGSAAMILVAFFLLYLAIKHKFEPLLLLTIAFGMLLTNLPGSTLRRLCEKVIAVNVSPLMATKYKMNIVSIALRSYNFMFRSNSFPEREKADLLIEPYNLEGYSNTELEKAEEIFMQGYNTTNDILERLLIDKGSIWKE